MTYVANDQANERRECINACSKYPLRWQSKDLTA